MAKPPNSLHVDMLRSPLGRARGLGAAHAGSAHWWAQTVTSIALVPLSLWFVWSVIRLIGASRHDVSVWLSAPIPMVLMIALVLGTFYHLALGVQVVIEDYVHQPSLRLGSILLVQAASVVCALLCIVSVLRLGFL